MKHIKSLAWCEYKTKFLFSKAKTSFLLPGQAVRIKPDLQLKQISALFDDTEIVTSYGTYDQDVIFRNSEMLKHANVVGGLVELTVKSKDNYPIVGNIKSLQDGIHREQFSVTALDWLNLAGRVVDEEKDVHSLVIAVEDKNGDEVVCPENGKVVRLRIIDCPIVFTHGHQITGKSMPAESCLYERIPDKDKQWWVWNNVVTMSPVPATPANKEEWLACTDNYVSVLEKKDNQPESNFLWENDPNFRRMVLKSRVPTNLEKRL
jgi:hypothetical protein